MLRIPAFRPGVAFRQSMWIHHLEDQHLVVEAADTQSRIKSAKLAVEGRRSNRGCADECRDGDGGKVMEAAFGCGDGLEDQGDRSAPGSGT
jgi:hypothetical protein